MYLTVHAACGALIGNYINDPLISLNLGLISHYFLDMLPHSDGNFPTKGHTPKSLRKMYFNKIVGLIYFDICLGIIVAAALLTNNAHFFNASVVWGMIGAILSDVLQVGSFVFKKNRVFKKLNEFHNFLHYSPRNQISLTFGHLTQLATLLILIRPLV
ncbi:MAG: hypothetical protein WCW26_01670 [Candidatus Buchananbacteria bacterium]